MSKEVLPITIKGTSSEILPVEDLGKYYHFGFRCYNCGKNNKLYIRKAVAIKDLSSQECEYCGCFQKLSPAI